MGAYRHGEEAAIENFLRTNNREKMPTAIVGPTEGVTLSEADAAKLRAYHAEQERRRSNKAKKRMASATQIEFAKFEAFAVRMAPIILEIQARKSAWNAIASELNTREIASFHGGKWFPSTIQAVLKRAEQVKKSNR